ncbi:sulfotransferase [uncultured Zhongshania sp.]|uniref:sulfotransferase n=1 Tax=uncultured Zhongshania sp. TaxID=1642288 RepID=UPI0030DB92D2
MGFIERLRNIGITNEISLGKLVDKVEDLFYREEELKKSIERKKGKNENWNNTDILAVTPTKIFSATKIVQCLYETTFPHTCGTDAIYGDKYPKYYKLDLQRVENVLPDIKYIHITRHPYDVVNSMLRRSHNAKQGKDSWTKNQTAEMAINEWIEAWNFSLNKDKKLLHIKYEDLIFSQDTTIQKISEFITSDLTKIDTQIISTTDHFEREFLNPRIIKKIDATLNDPPKLWEKSIHELQQYGEFKKINLKNENLIKRILNRFPRKT